MAAAATTVKVCVPRAIPEYAIDPEHADAAAASSEHVTDDVLVAENANDADVEEVIVDGPERIVTVGGGVTVQAYEVETDPVAAAATTVKVCVPRAIPEYAIDPEHADAAAASSEHVTDDVLVAENANDADVEEVIVDGPERIVTVGGGVTVQAYEVETDPVAAAATTVKVCVPRAIPEYAIDPEHADAAAASSEHVTDDVLVAENANDADVEEVIVDGPERIVTVGGGDANAAGVTVQVAIACEEPAALTARTARV